MFEVPQQSLIMLCHFINFILYRVTYFIEVGNTKYYRQLTIYKKAGIYKSYFYSDKCYYKLKKASKTNCL